MSYPPSWRLATTLTVPQSFQRRGEWHTPGSPASNERERNFFREGGSRMVLGGKLTWCSAEMRAWAAWVMKFGIESWSEA